jgi:outer membrane protein assembly factor BamB
LTIPNPIVTNNDPTSILNHLLPVLLLMTEEVTPLWRCGISGSVRSSPTVAGGSVYVGGGNQVYCIYNKYGSKQWKEGGEITSAFGSKALTVADGTAFAGGERGDLIALDAVSGEL